MTEHAAVLSLSEIDGTNGFRIDGVLAYDSSGFAVASAGDVNGDGYGDLIIGAIGAQPAGKISAGSSYVVFGKASGFGAALDLGSLAGANGFRLDGVAAGDLSGASVASAGDVNGDGYADVVVGAYRADPGGFDSAGSSYVVFGKASGFSAALDLATLDGSNGFRLDGVAAGDVAGSRVASAGDINGDGYSDVIVGAPNSNPGPGSLTGAAYVVFGMASGFAATLSLGSLNGSNGFRLDGAAASDFTGGSLDAAGDVNGDGVDDLLVSAYAADPNGNSAAGSAYVVFGKTTGFSTTLSLSSLDGSDGFRIDGAAANENAGYSVSSAGDVNGDGYADVVVGGHLASPEGRVNAGSSYVVFGRGSSFSPTFQLSDVNGANGFRIEGAGASDYSGYSVSDAGDFNGDGFADLIIGAIGADPGGIDRAGSSYVVFGKASGFGPSLNLGALDGNNGFRINGAAVADESGHAVSAAGDVNGDGLSDHIVGAPFADATGDPSSGSSYVIFGSLPRESVSRTGSAISQAIWGGADDDLLSGLDGADTLTANAGDDQLLGGAGADSLLGGSGDDLIQAGSGVDRLSGAAGDDVLPGGAGADRLLGGADSDWLSGGSGGDVLDGGQGDDAFDGGSGVDTVTYAVASAAVRVDLSLTGRQNTLGSGSDSFQAVENLTGSRFADSLAGDYRDNLLVGGRGNDTLSGGLGADTLTGAAGADVYAFNSALGGGNIDDIGGYSVPQDTIQLENAVFTALGAGALAAGAFYIGAAAHDADDRIIYNASSGALLYDADGAGGADAVQFAVMAHNLAMTATDFLVV
jgi:hypothetical protein